MVLHRKMCILKMFLANELMEIQHYIFGFVFWRLKKNYLKNFEDSTSLDSLINAHQSYIDSLHAYCKEVEEFNASINEFQTVCFVYFLFLLLFDYIIFTTLCSLKSIYYFIFFLLIILCSLYLLLCIIIVYYTYFIPYVLFM